MFLNLSWPLSTFGEKKDSCLRLAARMGSVRESSDAMAASKAAPAVAEGVAVPGTPLLPAAPGTPMPAMGPGTPGLGELGDTGKSPLQQAATSPPASPKDDTLDAAVPEPLERMSKKQRIEQTQEALGQLTSLVQTTMEVLQSIHSLITANVDSQKMMKDEVEALSKQIGHEGFTTKFILSNLTEYQRVLNNLTWQMTGHKERYEHEHQGADDAHRRLHPTNQLAPDGSQNGTKSPTRQHYHIHQGGDSSDSGA